MAAARVVWRSCQIEWITGRCGKQATLRMDEAAINNAARIFAPPNCMSE
jgi:hypothetical protein